MRHHNISVGSYKGHVMKRSLVQYNDLDPFVINCLYILDWFKSLRPFSCLQVSEHFDWLKQRLISHTITW